LFQFHPFLNALPIRQENSKPSEENPHIITASKVTNHNASPPDLGVILDSRLTLSAHVAALSRSGYYQLRQLRPLVQSMTVEAGRTAAAAFISCRLDYRNSLLYGLPGTLLRKLQSVQNATARLITGTRRSDLISPVLRELHWLPVRERVKFKVACPVAVRALACPLGRRLPSRVRQHSALSDVSTVNT